MKRIIAKTNNVLMVASLAVACIAIVGGPALAVEYLGPTAAVGSKDGKTLYVANYDAKQLAVVNVASGKVSTTIDMPSGPTGAVLSPDGSTLYVTCAAPVSTVCLVDVKTNKVSGKIPAGHTAIGPAISPDGSKLYVCNRFNNDVSVIDLATKKEIVRVPVTREPIAAVITPDGKTVFVGNHISVDRSDGYDVAAVVTAIDTASNEPTTIRLPNGATGVRGMAMSSDGKFAYAAHVLARYQMPTTQLERGWMNTNALSIIDTATKKMYNTVLLDDVDLGAANPWDVDCTADGKTICVSHAGTQELSVIDAVAMHKKLAEMPATEEEARAKGRTSNSGYASLTAADVPNDLAFLVGMRNRLKLEKDGPQGIVIIGDKAYVTLYFADALAVVDLEPKPGKAVSHLALGPVPEMTKQRRGEMLFNDAILCFQHWQSCASCHPDTRMDALNWDLMNDGLGNPKNAKSLLLSHKTPPTMISGIRADAETCVRAGITHIMFAVRPEADAEAIDEHCKSLVPVPSPALVDGKLSEAAERGKKLFNDEKIGCAGCHIAPLYTDLTMHDVGSRGQYDRRDTFDTPTLIECWRTAPYMHDGQYVTMKELFVRGKHGLKKAKLDEKQIDDLVEYVRSL